MAQSEETIFFSAYSIIINLNTGNYFFLKKNCTYATGCLCDCEKVLWACSLQFSSKHWHCNNHSDYTWCIRVYRIQVVYMAFLQLFDLRLFKASKWGHPVGPFEVAPPVMWAMERQSRNFSIFYIVLSFPLL